MNFKELIRTDTTSARIELTYKGTPDAGMLAWLDSSELKIWWKADSTIIEPFEGGMFYITWGEGDKSLQRAIYGVVEKIDTETNIIQVNNLMYISPEVKMSDLHLQLNFESLDMGQSKMSLIQTHNYSGELLQLYHSVIQDFWPKAYYLLKRYLEKKK